MVASSERAVKRELISDAMVGSEARLLLSGSVVDVQESQEEVSDAYEPD